MNLPGIAAIAGVQDRAVVADDPGMFLGDVNTVKVLLQRGLFGGSGGAREKKRRSQSEDQPGEKRDGKAHASDAGSEPRKRRRLGRHSIDPPRMMLCNVARLNMLAG